MPAALHTADIVILWALALSLMVKIDSMWRILIALYAKKQQIKIILDGNLNSVIIRYHLFFNERNR